MNQQQLSFLKATSENFVSENYPDEADLFGAYWAAFEIALREYEDTGRWAVDFTEDAASGLGLGARAEGLAIANVPHVFDRIFFEIETWEEKMTKSDAKESVNQIVEKWFDKFHLPRKGIEGVKVFIAEWYLAGVIKPITFRKAYRVYRGEVEEELQWDAVDAIRKKHQSLKQDFKLWIDQEEREVLCYGKPVLGGSRIRRFFFCLLKHLGEFTSFYILLQEVWDRQPADESDDEHDGIIHTTLFRLRGRLEDELEIKEEVIIDSHRSLSLTRGFLNEVDGKFCIILQL